MTNGKRAGVPHTAREDFPARHPIHVTCRLCHGLPSLRTQNTYAVVLDALIAGGKREDFRLVEFSVQSNHLHLIVEADGIDALSSAMRGLAVRLARRLNRLWRRAGQVFADRFHTHVLSTPLEVRNALRYVLHNARRHGRKLLGLDPFSSAPWFTGWCHRVPTPDTPSPFARARTWLLGIGWRERHGLLRPT